MFWEGGGEGGGGVDHAPAIVGLPSCLSLPQLVRPLWLSLPACPLASLLAASPPTSPLPSFPPSSPLLPSSSPSPLLPSSPSHHSSPPSRPPQPRAPSTHLTTSPHLTLPTSPTSHLHLTHLTTSMYPAAPPAHQLAVCRRGGLLWILPYWAAPVPDGLGRQMRPVTSPPPSQSHPPRLSRVRNMRRLHNSAAGGGREASVRSFIHLLFAPPLIALSNSSPPFS